jgi:surface protein
MFLNDENLEFLDISNFDVSIVNKLDDMFKNCIKLKYVNIKNTTSFDWMICSGVFADVVEEMIFCVEEFENPDKEFYVKLNVNDDIIELYDSSSDRLIETISGSELGSLVNKLNMASGIFVNKKV